MAKDATENGEGGGNRVCVCVGGGNGGGGDEARYTLMKLIALTVSIQDIVFPLNVKTAYSS